MKPILAASLLLVLLHGFGSLLRADFDPLSLCEVIGQSDLIAKGEIIEVRETTFVLRIEEIWRGAKLEQVEIEKFRDWACACRWTEYQKGQRVLVFVEKNGDRYKFPGIGGEAESPIVGEWLYCQFPNALPNREKLGKHEAAKVRLSTVAAAIRDYPTLFRFFTKVERGDGGSKRLTRIMEAASSLEIAAFGKRSQFHQFLVDSTRSAQDRLAGLK